MYFNIQVDLLILKTYYGQFTLTTKKSLHIIFNKVDVLHVRLTELHAAHQNLPFTPNRTLPLK